MDVYIIGLLWELFVLVYRKDLQLCWHTVSIRQDQGPDTFGEMFELSEKERKIPHVG